MIDFADLAGEAEVRALLVALETVDGSELAGMMLRLRQVDEIRPFGNTVLLGDGTPMFPTGLDRRDLRLPET